MSVNDGRCAAPTKATAENTEKGILDRTSEAFVDGLRWVGQKGKGAIDTFTGEAQEIAIFLQEAGAVNTALATRSLLPTRS